jgi:hypothetical protein
MKWNITAHGKDCNEIFDNGYYVVGDVSQVSNWPFTQYGMLMVYRSSPYTVQIAISTIRFEFRLNTSTNKDRWEAWQTLK